MPQSLLNRLASAFSHFRHSLAHVDALPQLTLLSVLVGVACGLLIVLFRLAIEIPLSIGLHNNHENFESLPAWLRFTLPVTGALLIGLCLQMLHKKYHHVSVGHVLDRLHNYESRMPFGNGLVQFLGAIISLLSGQSVGREGPAVHIGATSGSLLGQWLRLPNNSLGILLGCGVAAAISASFNTPIAAVIFAMEVVLMRYSINGFIPVIMASVCGALVSRAFLGEETFFQVSAVPMNWMELPYLVLVGFVIALFASFFIYFQLRLNRFNHRPVALRLLFAGLVTGCLALIFPQVMGLGYDTIENALSGDLAIHLLLGIALAKIIATAVSIGLGMPAGVIGPQLVIGACLGGLMGTLGSLWFLSELSHLENYVLLGMTAMMAAVINAPLAALTAVVELTYNPALIFPSMLVIVVACITTRLLTGYEGIFVAQLEQQGTSLNTGAMAQTLGSIGARSAMNTNFIQIPQTLTLSQAKRLLDKNPLWLVVVQKDTPNGEQCLLMRASDLALRVNELKNTAIPDQEEPILELLEIPGQRFNLIAIDELASLLSAKKVLDQNPGCALYVEPQVQSKYFHTVTSGKILGIITADTVMNSYH